MIVRFIGIIFAFITITSCSPKVFQPLYNPAPLVSEKPNANLIPQRFPPSIERDRLELTIFEEAIPNKKDYFNNPSENLNRLGKSPSVILSMPKISSVKTITDSEDYLNNKDKFSGVYKTDGDYNKAEQSIENALLRQGFNVLDRAKFEAKLRDSRDQEAAQNSPYGVIDGLLNTPETKSLIERLNKALSNGDITQTEFDNYMFQIKKNASGESAGSNRTEDEMNDNPEILRIAEKEGADYLFQINKVSIEDAGKRKYDIHKRKEVIEFLDRHPGLEIGNNDGELPSSIESNWLLGNFSSKLISVKSGSIAWLGEHEIESWEAEPIEISIEVQKKVENAERINTAISQFNSKVSMLSDKIAMVAKELNSAYKQASIEKEFKKEEDLLSYKYGLKSRIKKLEEKHNSLIDELNAMNDEAVPEAFESWAFSYIISDPIFEPNLIESAAKTSEGKQNLLKHRENLIEQVTLQLIQTIK